MPTKAKAVRTHNRRDENHAILCYFGVGNLWMEPTLVAFSHYTCMPDESVQGTEAHANGTSGHGSWDGYHSMFFCRPVRRGMVAQWRRICLPNGSPSVLRIAHDLRTENSMKN